MIGTLSVYVYDRDASKESNDRKNSLLREKRSEHHTPSSILTERRGTTKRLPEPGLDTMRLAMASINRMWDGNDMGIHRLHDEVRVALSLSKEEFEALNGALEESWEAIEKLELEKAILLRDENGNEVYRIKAFSDRNLKEQLFRRIESIVGTKSRLLTSTLETNAARFHYFGKYDLEIWVEELENGDMEVVQTRTDPGSGATRENRVSWNHPAGVRDAKRLWGHLLKKQ